MTRKKSEGNGGESLIPETPEQLAADKAEGTSPDSAAEARAEGLRRWRQKGGRRDPAAPRPSYIVIATNRAGVREVVHVAATVHQLQRWLDLTSALLLANYQEVACYRGKPVQLHANLGGTQ